MISLILTCAGVGIRAGYDKNKLLQITDGITVAEKVFNVAYESNLFDEIIVVSSQDDFDFFTKTFRQKAKVVLGGKTRFLSVKNALEFVKNDIVLIHDGARPFVTEKIFKNCIESVKKYRSGITAIKETNTICKANENGDISQVIDKKDVYAIQTPQGFYTNDIKKAFSLAVKDDYPDESSVYSEFIGVPKISNGEISNKKLTYKEDFDELYAVRTGIGFDCHKLVNGRKLILGGIVIPHDKGLLGHSDADVLTHAIMDAMLSSVALKDIGYHFSDKDEKFKDADSIELLKQVKDMLYEKGYKVANLSATIMAEKPKLLPYIDEIKSNLSKILEIAVDDIGLTATTLEGLGFIGREEGICAQASVISKHI